MSLLGKFHKEREKAWKRNSNSVKKWDEGEHLNKPKQPKFKFLKENINQSLLTSDLKWENNVNSSGSENSLWFGSMC